MSFRTWMYVFAITGLTLSGSVQAQQQDTESEQATANEQTTTDQLPFTLPVIIIESDEASEASQSEESERTQREKDDLVAQQGMNTATQAMNEATQSMKWASWVSTGLVGLGTLLLIWTLLLTRAANKTTRSMATDTREIGEAQVRAYVSAYDMNLEVLEDRWRFTLSVKNSGQSPARLVSMEYGIIASQGPEGFTAPEAMKETHPEHAAFCEKIAGGVVIDFGIAVDGQFPASSLGEISPSEKDVIGFGELGDNFCGNIFPIGTTIIKIPILIHFRDVFKKPHTERYVGIFAFLSETRAKEIPIGTYGMSLINANEYQGQQE